MAIFVFILCVNCIEEILASSSTALLLGERPGLVKYDVIPPVSVPHNANGNSKDEQCPFDSPPYRKNALCTCNRISLEIRCENLDALPNFTKHSPPGGAAAAAAVVTWKSVHLEKQFIREVASGAFAAVRVQRIALNFNPVTLGLQSDSFRGQETTLSELYLGGCRLRRLPSELIAGLAELRYLHLWGNEIDDIPWGFFDGSYNLRELELWANNLEEIGTETFRGLRRLKRLDLYGNRISALDRSAFGRLTELEWLNLGKNSIHALDAEAFSQLTSLKALRLDRNQIQYVYSDAFYRLKNLLYLSLSDNLINFLLDDVFSNLSRLVYLTLERNSLEYAWTRTFDGLRSLRVLHLSHNDLVNLPEGIFRQSPRLDRLFLESNRLRTIHRCVVFDATRLRILSFIGNGIECDCRTAWMREVQLEAGTSVWGSCQRVEDVTANPLLQGNGTEEETDISCPSPSQRC